MSPIYISILAGILFFLIFNIIEEFILGDRGRDNQISNYFRYIKGGRIIKKTIIKKPINKDKLVTLSRKEYIIHAVPVCIMIFIIIYIASKLILLSLLISCLGLFYPKAIENNRIMKRNEVINIQLKDALNSIVSSLKAGLSINSALIKCTDDLERLYALEKYKPMLEEFKIIKNDLNMGVSVDDVLINFMNRIRLEDVDDFVNSVIIVRQKGGNLVEVIDNVSKMINDKRQIKREIETLTVSKKMEAKILTIVPVGVILFLSIFSEGYIKPLYESFLGRVLIAIGFGCLAINYYISKKIVDIKI